MRKIADATRVGISGVALVQLAAAGPEPAVNPLIAAIVTWAIRPLRAWPAADALFVVLLSIDAVLVTTGAMDRIDRQDTFGHLALSAAIAPIVLAAGEASGWLNRGATRRPVALAALLAATILALGLAWELFEWLADYLFGSEMSRGRADTIHDLVCDALGAAAGSLVTVAFLTRHQPDSRPHT